MHRISRIPFWVHCSNDAGKKEAGTKETTKCATDSTSSNNEHSKSLKLPTSPLSDAIATFLQLLLVLCSPVTTPSVRQVLIPSLNGHNIRMVTRQQI